MPGGQEGKCSAISAKVTSFSSCPTSTLPSVRDWGRGEGGGRVEEAKFLALPSQPSLGVVHLQPDSERYLEDTPGNQLQLCRCLYLVCRQTQLTSSHPWRVSEGVLLPTLVPPFPSVSGGIIHPSQSMSPPTPALSLSGGHIAGKELSYIFSPSLPLNSLSLHHWEALLEGFPSSLLFHSVSSAQTFP